MALLSNGDGSFRPLPAIPGSIGILSGKVADFNGDGHADLLLELGEADLFRGKGDGTFTQQSIANGSFSEGYWSVAVGDFKGESHLDGVLADACTPGWQFGAIDYHPGAVGGAFGAPTFLVPTSIPNAEALDTADFNGDGKLDLLIAGSSGSFVSLGNGDGNFQMEANQLIPLALPFFYSPMVSNPDFFTAMVADLDDDGKPDAVVIDSTAGVLSLFVNDRTGSFPDAAASPYTFQLPAGSFQLAVADFNQDGLPDIVVSTPSGKILTLMLSSKPLAKPTVSVTTTDSLVLVSREGAEGCKSTEPQESLT